MTIAICVTVAGGIWLLGRFILLPQLLFANSGRQRIIYLPQQPATQAVMLQLSGGRDTAQLSLIQDLPAPHPTVPMKRQLSLQLGTFVSQVIEVPLSVDALQSGRSISAGLQAATLWQRLWSARSQPERAREQLRFVADAQPGAMDVFGQAQDIQNSILWDFTHEQGGLCPIAVINATAMPGLAERTSSFLERTGLLVVRTDSGELPLEHTRLQVSAQIAADCQPILDAIQDGLVLEAEVLNPAEQPLFGVYRADILLELGKDWQPASS